MSEPADVPSAGETSDQRRRLLERVLAFREPLPELLAVLATLPFDSETELAQFTAAGLRDVLLCVETGEINVDDLAEWAERVRDRDDVGYPQESDEVLREVMLCIACPELFGEATPAEVARWLWRVSRELPDRARKEPR